MKTSRVSILIVTEITIGLLAVCWCVAQQDHKRSRSESKTDNYVALKQLQSYVAYLQNAGETNALRQFNEYVNTSAVVQNAADLGFTLAVLQRLRDGHTNVVVELLEVKLSSDIIGFAESYGKMPAPLRESISFKLLGDARDYRDKFPFKHRYSNISEGVTNAFKLLDEQIANDAH